MNRCNAILMLLVYVSRLRPEGILLKGRSEGGKSSKFKLCDILGSLLHKEIKLFVNYQ